MALGKPKLSVKTPDNDEINAMLVDGVHDDLIDAFLDPSKTNRHFIVAAIAVDEVVQHEGGDAQAKWSIRHLEFTDSAALLAAYKKRTRKVALPDDDTVNQLDLPAEKSDATVTDIGDAKK